MENNDEDKLDLQRQFCYAIADGDYEKVRDFIRSGAIDVNYGDPSAGAALPSLQRDMPIENALVAAVQWSDPEMLKILLDEGKADVNARGCKGRTALHVARRDEEFTMLIEHGADVNARTVDGRTPLMCTSSVEKMGALIRSGANINHRDVEGNTALHHAVRMANEHPTELLCLVDTLIELGADPRLTNHDGKTAGDMMFWTTKETKQAIAARTNELNLRDALAMSTSRQHEQARQGSGRRM